MRKVFTLLSVALLTALTSMSLTAQNCGTATRTAVDCKFGTPDAVGWAMQQFFNDGSTATWNFQSGATFQENADGTATLTGVITQYGSSPARNFNVVVNFTGKSTTTTGTPETNNLCPPGSTASWQYYTLSSGSLTGVAGTACEGSKVTLSQHMMPSQYGIGGANQCSETNNLGMTGWFEYQIVSQPSNGWLTIMPYSLAPVVGQADFCIRLSGTPTTCGGNPCDTDTTPPVFANCPSSQSLTASGTCTNASWTAPTATDNCGTPTVTQTAGPASGSCFPVGTTTVTYTATDTKGNKATCSFTVTVTAPACVSSITRVASNASECSTGNPYGIFFNGQLYTISNGIFTENSDLTATLIGTTSLGTVAIKFTGRTTSGTPVIGCVTPKSTSDWYYYTNFSGTIGTTSVVSNPMHIFQIGTGANYNTDGVYGASGWWTSPSGATGDINLVLSGNTATLNQLCPNTNPCATDVTPPVFANCPANIVKTPTVSGTCWTISWTAPTATDNCSTPTVTQTAGPANGSCFAPGSYTVTYTATDAKGNKATCTFTITVNPYNACATDVTPPVFANCPANIVKTPTVSGTCWTIGWTAPTATDNCSTPTVVQTAGPANNSCLAPGTYTVTYTATDAKANSATCSFTITVNPYNACATDVTPPVFANCPANIVKTPTVSGTCWTIGWTAPTATDNCSTPTVVQTAGPANNSCLAPGTYTVTYTATDAKGNKATCTFTITVNSYKCPQPPTPAGWMYLGQYNNNFYYKYTGGDCNYYTAKYYVSNIGGHLAYCKEAGEKDFLKTTVAGTCWLGITRYGTGWKCDDNSTPNYFNWSAGEPNNYGGIEDCAQLYSDGTWNDANEGTKCWAVAVIPCGGTTPVVCNPTFDPNKVYKCVNRNSGKCLDVDGGSYSAKASVNQWDYHGGDNQKWSIVPTTNGYCKLVAKHSGKVLSCSNNWSGAQLCQDDYTSSWGWWFGSWGFGNAGDKDWKIECVNGGYKLTHKMTNYACHEGSTIANGTHCQLFSWNSSNDEIFDLVEVSGNAGQWLQNTKVLSLSASVEPNRARIEWVNNTGATNDFFQVEKMNTATGAFETIANVKSQTTTDMASYVAYDVKPVEGDNFYRINAISLDGSSNVSDIQKVNFKGLAGNLSVFPNPADEVLNIDLTSYKGSAVSLFVYNHLGQAVITQQIEKVTDGLIQVDVSNQQMGNYLVRIASKGKNDQTKSFILNK